MKFITIQNQLGETVAINPKNITSICYGLNNKTVMIYLGSEILHTIFKDLQSAVDYVEHAWWDRYNHAKSIKWEDEEEL